MRRRSKPGSARGKTRSRKTLTSKTPSRKTPKRRAAKAARPHADAAAAEDAAADRLTRELTEALEQQRATSEVLRVISSSSGDLQRVFDTMLENARRVCDAQFGNIYRWDGDALYLIASHNTPAVFADYRRRVPFRPGPTSLVRRMVNTKMVVHVTDAATQPGYVTRSDQSLIAAVELGGVRTYLAVPMLKDNELIGAITVYRREVRPFTDKQIALITSLASQAVIAIENARLLSELRRRTEELGRSVAELQRERNNKLMNLEAMAAAIGHEVRQPLAGIVSNGGAALRFLGHAPPNLEETRLALNRMVRDSHRASQVFDNIRALFGKSDQGHEPVDVNEVALGVLQALGEEIKEQGIVTRTELSAELPPVLGHRGQLHEVFVNLVRNAIEAMAAVRDDQRLLQVRAEPQGGNAVVVEVEDSGPGIDPKQVENIFDAFITTKSHGMGLGLAICRMIIERHAGQLSVVPAQPRGSIFRVVLPTAQAAKPTT